ncbi:ferrous iron transporter B [Lysobacter sp. 5GHs7-4]|uniref:type IV pilus assembly protein FimV n=1 Tax=Lysobacter sp. 5GHs7-4 TaxID=2904253 RepID=UPI001E3769CA|nr:FimV/HubP family polar landmark protein [Lysobacter sp. 5GHs7-4]UHQ21718.1 ferrous iron transporter B [Lysobacter sp. 5GHs7-4]
MKHRFARTALALALALASGGACALGLGQIEVKSRSDQPLLAEIPIVSSDPAELEQLQARLASPETFARIGLMPPTGIVSDLQFQVALDARGNPVIRVTSEQPVNQPLVTFLVEVDWGQGRLVREYSALIDTPKTVSAPLQPPIEAPVSAPSNLIERPLDPAAVVASDTPTDPAAVVPDPAAVDAVPAAPVHAFPERPTAIAIAPPAPSPVPSVAVAPANAETARDGAIEVKRGDALSRIASGLELGEGYSLDQTMVALLRANPDAFIGGDVNRLKQGAILRVPSGNEVASIDAGEASALVRSQVQQWRQARSPAPQPAVEPVPLATAPRANAAGTGAATDATASSGARLEIVPPGASRATRAGTQSGINAGGEGQMLRQELQESNESLAAREAELTDLKGRVAELEQLQKQQQQLIQLKDTELAAAQQRLAESNQKQAAAQGGAMLPWAITGAVLLLAVLGGWFMRRRPAKPVFRAPGAAAPSIADAFAEPASEPAAPAVEEAATPAASKPTQAPFWTTAPAAPANERKVPAWHVAAVGHGESPAQEPLLAAQPGQERLELARAYMDLGDHESARQLLGEVAVNGDLAARQQAARMLRELE